MSKPGYNNLDWVTDPPADYNPASDDPVESDLELTEILTQEATETTQAYQRLQTAEHNGVIHSLNEDLTVGPMMMLLHDRAKMSPDMMDLLDLLLVAVYARSNQDLRALLGIE